MQKDFYNLFKTPKALFRKKYNVNYINTACNMFKSSYN